MAQTANDNFTSPQLEAAKRNRLMLGLFLPLQSGAWSPSTAPRETSWTFDYNVACAQRAEALGAQIRALRVVYEGQQLGGITMSVGVAVYPDHGVDAKQVLKAADRALYLAKANGRDGVAVFE